MPITNEILAPYYLKVKYVTPAARHTMTLYFAEGSIIEPVPSLTPTAYRVKASANATPVNIAIAIGQVFSRVSTVLYQNTVVDEIQIWQSATGNNSFFAYNPVPSSPSYGSVNGVAAAYFAAVYASADRQLYRQFYFDAIDAKPQRNAGYSPQDTDDNTLAWYMLKSDVPFATQDGKRLVRQISTNTGYNRKLARAYGRQVAP